MRYFLDISFKGDLYAGWQKQPNGIGIQQLVEDALYTLFREKISIVGAGRTDAGVNALSLPAHADLPFEGDAFLREKWRRALNGILPHDIHVRRIVPVHPTAHARFDATQRTYLYYIAAERDPFMGPYVLPIREKLSFEAMNAASQFLIGTHDFTSFSRLHGDTYTNLCTVSEAFWQPSFYPGTSVFTISANRFLRNMVRAIVGTLLDVGRGKIAPESVIDIMNKKNREEAGSSVRGEALFLAKVQYPAKIFLSSEDTI